MSLGPSGLVGGFPVGGLWPLAAPSLVLPASAAVDDAEYLVEIEAYQGGVSATMLPSIVGSFAVGAPPFGSSISSGVVTLRFSDTHWIGEPDDPDMPDTVYDGRVAAPVQFDRQMPLLPEQRHRQQVNYGGITLANGDGVLDGMVKSYPVAGRRVRVLRGPRSATWRSTAYADHAPVLVGLAVGWEPDEDRVVLEIRDPGYRLESPLQTTLYAGTGGAEGDAQWAGKPKPLLLGKVRNFAPDLIDQANKVYCLSSRAIQAIDAVRDQGAPLTFDADYADYAAMVAATISVGGHYVSCLAQGLIRTKTTPVALTVDARGDAEGGYVDTHADIARRILSDFCGCTNDDYSWGSFSAWPDGTAGVYFGSDARPSGADAMDRVAGSIAACWGQRGDGVIVGGQLVDPAFQQVSRYIGLTDLRGPVRQLPAPAVPRYRQIVGYQALGKTQSDGDLAGSVSASDRLYYGQAYRSVTAIDTDVQLAYPFAFDPPPLVSLYDDQSRAQTVADILLGLHKVERQAFQMPIGPLGYLLDIGDVINLVYPRFGLDGGKNFLVVGLDQAGDDVTATIWG